MPHKKAIIYRWIPLAFLLVVLFLFFYFHLYRYLNIKTIKEHRQLYLAWTRENYLLAAGSFLLLYSLIIAISIPGAIFLTLAGGFIFGTWWGTLYVLIGETIGCTFTFLAVKISLGEWIAKKTGKWIKKMEADFSRNAFNYIITLRLIPILPFWLVNIASALLKVNLITFITSTFLGIIPLTLIYVSLGHSLAEIVDKQVSPNLDIFMQPHVYIPLIALAGFAMLPVIYQYFRKHKKTIQP